MLVNFVSKSISYPVWCPDIARAHVTLARGIHFSSMGHSAPRSVLKQGEAPNLHKRLEILPEEALYLVERGSLFVTKHSSTLKSVIPGMDDIDGARRGPYHLLSVGAALCHAQADNVFSSAAKFLVSFICVPVPSFINESVETSSTEWMVTSRQELSYGIPTILRF